jgi:xanthine dehydrogenase YagR molybdenum-binding subunit
MAQSNAVLGTPRQRVDGRLKVTGAAMYAADFKVEQMAYACLIQSTIGSGSVVGIDQSEAERSPGVIAILTRRNAPKLQPLPEELTANGTPGESRLPFQDDQVYFQGQHLGAVIAETFEQARQAAALVRVRYQPGELRLDLQGLADQAIEPRLFGTRIKLQDKRGDVDWVWANMPQVRLVDATYTTPIENHNPIEPGAVLAAWDGSDHLTLHLSTRGVDLTQKVVAGAFGLAIENVRIICPFLGEHFGSKGFNWSYFLVAAAAARLADRPVRLVLTRPQMFDSMGQRARTIQTLGLAADENGKLAALKHSTLTHSSMIYQYTEPCGNLTRLVYACPNVQINHHLVQLNYPTPCPMRAPGEAAGFFALESAMDELAVKLNLDPIELRVRNYAEKDEFDQRPWSSKRLHECYDRGATKFGWSSRNPKPGSTRDPDGKLVGWGMATAAYPAYQQPAAAKVILVNDGSVIVRGAMVEAGAGTYTVMTQLVSDTLGVPMERVRFELGDTQFPPAPVNGGSWLTASVGPAVIAACTALRDKLISLAVDGPSAALPGVARADTVIADGRVSSSKDNSQSLSFSDLLAKTGNQTLEADGSAKPGDAYQKLAFLSFGAIFAEVRVDPDLGEVRITRIVGVYDVGKILNPMLARSQILGGITFGIGMALMEATVPDTATGRMVNANLAEYYVPVATDVPPDFTVEFLDIPDPNMAANGARGLGEIGIVGTPAAIANAIYHATGKRIRDLPITPDKLI